MLRRLGRYILVNERRELTSDPWVRIFGRRFRRHVSLPIVTPINPHVFL